MKRPRPQREHIGSRTEECPVSVRESGWTSLKDVVAGFLGASSLTLRTWDLIPMARELIRTFRQDKYMIIFILVKKKSHCSDKAWNLRAHTQRD